MFSDIQQQSLDIDWFFTNGNELGFVASTGGPLPRSIADAEDEYLLADFFVDMPTSWSVEINPEIEKIIGSKADARYLESFVYMAERGFFAFDKSKLGDFSDTHYHWVAKPALPLTLNKLPEEIASIVSRTVYNGDLNGNIDIANIL